MTISDLKSRTISRYSGAAFTAPWSDGVGDTVAITASLELLERVQSDCVEIPISAEEFVEAKLFLESRSEKASWALAAFEKGLALEDQSQRFEATASALRQLNRQFGR